MTTKFLTQWDPAPRVQHENTEPSRTKQSFADEVNINNIVGKYKKTGLLTHLNDAEAKYLDVTEVGDFQDAQNIMIKAQADFMALPASARKVFNHSTAEFLDAAHDPDKRDLLVKAGLLPEPTPTPTPEPSAPAPEGGE